MSEYHDKLKHISERYVLFNKGSEHKATIQQFAMLKRAKLTYKISPIKRYDFHIGADDVFLYIAVVEDREKKTKWLVIEKWWYVGKNTFELLNSNIDSKVTMTSSGFIAGSMLTNIDVIDLYFGINSAGKLLKYKDINNTSSEKVRVNTTSSSEEEPEAKFAVKNVETGEVFYDETYRALARQCGISDRSVSRLVKGESKRVGDWIKFDGDVSKYTTKHLRHRKSGIIISAKSNRELTEEAYRSIPNGGEEISSGSVSVLLQGEKDIVCGWERYTPEVKADSKKKNNKINRKLVLREQNTGREVSGKDVHDLVEQTGVSFKSISLIVRGKKESVKGWFLV